MCPYGRDRATSTLPSSLPLPRSTHRAGGTWGPSSSPQSWRGSIHSFGYPRMSCTKGTLGLPSGLNQTEQPVLRLAVALKDEVVGLWQSPERSSEGWHQLVAYPGRITEQFQVRQCYCTQVLSP